MADKPKNDNATIEETKSDIPEGNSSGKDKSSEKGEKPQPKKKRHVLRTIIIIIVIVVVLALAALIFMVFRGVIAPGDAAAKYDVLSYIQEDEVTDYIDTYREQMGYAESDDGWAEFLGENGMTPEVLRSTTIRQLIIDNEIDRKAASLGLSVDESELDDTIQSMKESYAFGSDEIWAETLEMYGTNEEQLRETYAHSQLQDKVCEAEVPVPSVNDEEIFDYLVGMYPEGLKAKHVYYLTVAVEDGEDELEVFDTVQQIRDGLASEKDLNSEIFGYAVQAYCTDEDVVSRGGANGWSIDMSDYSDNYQTVVENTKKNHLSTAFREEDAEGDVSFSIIWIDDVVKLPNITDEDIDSIDQEEYLSVLPDTLKSYFSDCTAQVKWTGDCDDYLGELYDKSNPVLYPIAAPLPSYYVDMSDVEVVIPDEIAQEAEGSDEDESASSDENESTEEGSGEEAQSEEDASED